jgi:hypothetical protein
MEANERGPVMPIDLYLANFDLGGLFGLECLLGVFLSGAALSLIPKCSGAAIHWVQRVFYLALGLVLAWSYLFADAKDWQPWPPHVALVSIIDGILAARIILRRTDFLQSEI